MMSLKHGRIGGTSSSRPASAAGRVLRFALAAVAGLFVGMVALLLATLVGTALVVRRLLGRRGAASVRYTAGRAAPRRTPASGEVIDVQAREVGSGRD